MIRSAFHSELEELKKEIQELGDRVEDQFSRTVHAMAGDNKAALKDIIEEDEEINELELKLNEQATLVIARQQPVASDLRRIIVCLKVSSDLERMGDLCVDMAKAYLHLPSLEAFHAFEKKLTKMEEKIRHMLHEVMEAYGSLDMLKAQQIATLDDEIDQTYGSFVKELFQTSYSADQTAQLAFTARYMERIGDYCTNIAEWIIYEVNGQRFDLN
ncbi:phosphate signaling complex protein PhoU [Alkalicoccus urumqiensis]|uniref:Phosphate-specific transport system accessory protein PhoU n=1 Tax=Alkalicoccus urumqiensis TaxID=1548213 RepID=A0A2P6MF21_ALKUR|nr:phosphate signaling complex protein PhoU [Alkalicoccus urumqiensis]PRO64878.1 phosphate transport system regulatory protein PhoU [Alkalicoccus urumqiensis]